VRIVEKSGSRRDRYFVYPEPGWPLETIVAAIVNNTYQACNRPAERMRKSIKYYGGNYTLPYFSDIESFREWAR
jgi:hypothetical protein